MAIFVGKDGSIKIYRGDSGNVKVSGFPEGSSYLVSFAITDPSTGEIILERDVRNEGSASVIFSFAPEEIEVMMVDVGAKYRIYNYGIKLCDDNGREDTLIPKVTMDAAGNPVFSKPAKIYCYPKYAEGLLPAPAGDEENNGEIVR